MADVIVTNQIDEPVNVRLTNKISSDLIGDLDYLQWNLSPADYSVSEGLMFWNADFGTLNIGMPGGNVNLQLGQELIVRCRNTTGSVISNGSVVYITGASGGKPLISLADADLVTVHKTIGVATEDISNNSNGYVTLNGFVNDINTSGISAGSEVYVSQTPGEFTSVKPSPPVHSVKVGTVTQEGVGNGKLFVNVGQGFDFDDLHDVLISSVANNDLLSYNSVSGYWNNVNDIVVNDVTASSISYSDDLTIITGTDKTVVLSETVWDDLRVNINAIKVTGASQPAWTKFKDDGAGSVGVYTHYFSPTVMNEGWFEAQLPHKWKEGTTIYPHVHWAPVTTNTGTVRWGLEYTWANPNGTFSNTTIIYGEQAGAGTAFGHQIVNFGSGITASGKTISGILLCRIFRDAAHANDTYTGNAALLSSDIHYEVDTIGSRQTLTK